MKLTPEENKKALLIKRSKLHAKQKELKELVTELEIKKHQVLGELALVSEMLKWDSDEINEGEENV